MKGCDGLTAAMEEWVALCVLAHGGRDTDGFIGFGFITVIGDVGCDAMGLEVEVIDHGLM